jgi:type II secretory pathway component PulJ
MNNFCSKMKNEQGLTLVELMIVLLLSMLLMAAVYMTYQLQHSSGKVQFHVAAAQQDLRAVMEIISTDIQHAGLDPRPTLNIQGIDANDCGQNSLRMRMDLNGNGQTNTVDEDISYRLDNNGNLLRVDNSPGVGITRVLANNVIALNFTYKDRQTDGTRNKITPTGPASAFDANTLTSAQADAVRFVEVTIRMQTDKADPQTNQRIERGLTRTVCRRNGIPLD